MKKIVMIQGEDQRHAGTRLVFMELLDPGLEFSTREDAKRKAKKVRTLPLFLFLLQLTGREHLSL